MRIEAIPDLGRNIRFSSARQRLQEAMLDDEIVTIRVDAAEQLVRTGGEDGLLAVLPNWVGDETILTSTTSLIC
ncbi:hypothetical protein [Nocardia barduliensis]|uniref:hypothetical protein n=1 Tax=Nocardia barduliensis TaxID=2736643 RepID=UPI001572287F|nr:hypothetical protein [Nocardia barduliensis]